MATCLMLLCPALLRATCMHSLGFAWWSVAASALMLVMAPKRRRERSNPRLCSWCLWASSPWQMLSSSKRWNSEQTASSLEPQRHAGACCGTSTQEVQQSGGCARVATLEGAEPGGAEETARSGFPMEDAGQLCEDTAAEADAGFGDTSNLEAGNALQRRALIKKQFPKAAVLGCSDSRVLIELVFDQGLGGIFAIRVARNVLEMSTTVVEYIAPVPTVTYAAPSPVIEYVVPAPVVEVH